MKRNAPPRLHTVSTLRSPFGFVRTSELPTGHHKEFLTFTIPSDEMKMSEARAWATAQALQWARGNKTVIVGDIEWRVNEDTICALVATTIPPRIRGAAPRTYMDDAPRVSKPRPPAPHPGCQLCDDVATYGPEFTVVDIAADLRISTSTVTRHRVKPVSA